MGSSFDIEQLGRAITYTAPGNVSFGQIFSKKLRIKFGVDPTAPDLHLGHFVVIRTLAALQKMGHTVVLVVGDATARIGDPSGRNRTRPVLTHREIAANLKTYVDQVKGLLNMAKVKIVYNSEWFDKLNFTDLVGLAQHVTCAQILERDDFTLRLKDRTDIGLHELYYPLMQAYDSVEIRSEAEIGGTDQIFNMLLGRDLQRKFHQKEQIVLGCELLVGTDGIKKMSKSYGNTIALNQKPELIYTQLMQVSDEAMLTYARALTTLKLNELEAELKRGTNPKDVKHTIAHAIVEELFDLPSATRARSYFERVVGGGELPSDIATRRIKGTHTALDLIMVLKLAESKNEARRLIAQGGIRLDERVLLNPAEPIAVRSGMIVKRGKRGKIVEIKTN